MSYFAGQEREFLGGFSRKATQHLKVRGREQEESLAWRFLVDLMCAGWLVPIFPGLYWGLLLHLFFQGTPEQGCQVRCSGELFEWDLYFSQRHILQKLVQNPNRVHLKQKKKWQNKNKKQKNAVLGIILCSSRDTDGKLERSTENVPTTWESISLIWPRPKYSRVLFKIHSVKCVEGGSDGGGQPGREHRKQWQCNSTISASIETALNVLDKRLPKQRHL